MEIVRHTVDINLFNNSKVYIIKIRDMEDIDYDNI